MKYFMLNNLGLDWIFEAENEDEATFQYINEMCGCSTIKKYEKYCKNAGQDSSLEWEECGKYGFKASEEVTTDSRGTKRHTFIFDNGEEE